MNLNSSLGLVKGVGEKTLEKFENANLRTVGDLLEFFPRKYGYSEGIHSRLIKKAQHLWRCVPLNVLTQGSSLRSPTLGYQKRTPDGVRQSANILCAALPFEREVDPDMVFVISYSIWLRNRANPTGVPFL